MILGRLVQKDLEKALKETISSNEKDVYGAVAAKLLGVAVAQVTEQDREWIKGQTYAMTDSK